MKSPLFTHDCDGCTFLDHFNGADLYFCPQNGNPTVIARMSSDGPDYMSGMEFAEVGHPFLSKALEMAKTRGLVK